MNALPIVVVLRYIIHRLHIPHPRPRLIMFLNIPSKMHTSHFLPAIHIMSLLPKGFFLTRFCIVSSIKSLQVVMRMRRAHGLFEKVAARLPFDFSYALVDHLFC